MFWGCLGNELAEAGHSVPELRCVDFMNALVRIFSLLPVGSGCLETSGGRMASVVLRPCQASVWAAVSPVCQCLGLKECLTLWAVCLTLGLRQFWMRGRVRSAWKYGFYSSLIRFLPVCGVKGCLLRCVLPCFMLQYAVFHVLICRLLHARLYIF